MSSSEFGYRKTMLYPQKDNKIPFPSGNSGKIDGFFSSLLNASKAGCFAGSKKMLIFFRQLDYL
ncbi:hypothetical protein [Thiolapillus sp.]|uniref:hypothetical protein n=1 Tax=Thiolapillus sp. TaxID=2017437 RepID=UPI0025E1C6F2|nr:hypothetical protein [Thiolapillus sp.]